MLHSDSGKQGWCVGDIKKHIHVPSTLGFSTPGSQPFQTVDDATPSRNILNILLLYYIIIISPTFCILPINS